MDKFEREITVGCFIVYGHLLDRSAGLRVAKVLALKWCTGKWSYSASGWHITTLGIDDGWDNIPKLCAKKGTLLFPDRAVVVPFDMLPDKYQKLYRDAGLAQ